eukprot:3465622-Lingulodinium_polyedra.AAC.1
MKDKAAQQLNVQAAKQPKEAELGSRSCQSAQDYMGAKQPEDRERALFSPLSSSLWPPQQAVGRPSPA